MFDISLTVPINMVREVGSEVIIVGGSLSGLTFALACAKRGICTRVLERIKGPHQSGGALGVDRQLLMRVVGLDTFNDDATSVFPVLTRHRNAASWDAVYGWLRELVHQHNSITLAEGITISEVVQNAQLATAIMSDGQRFDAAIIVGADGYRSVVRGEINPEASYGSYAGYLLWRGMVQEENMPCGTVWPNGNDGAAFITTSGSRLIAYPVAGQTNTLDPGRRQICFTWYDYSRDILLQAQNCLSSTRHVLGSLARENIPKEVFDDLREQAARIWPEPWRAFVVHALDRQDIFATPVAEYFPTRLHRGRLAVIGDAAHVVSPVTGKGFRAGVLDAEALADRLAQAFQRPERDVPSALELFADDRLSAAQDLASASMKWSRAFLRNASEVKGLPGRNRYEI